MEEILAELNLLKNQEVFVQISLHNVLPVATTYRGVLSADGDSTDLVGWTIVPGEILSLIRGMALNLHLFEKHSIDRLGRLHFQKSADGITGVSSTLVIATVDPFPILANP